MIQRVGGGSITLRTALGGRKLKGLEMNALDISGLFMLGVAGLIAIAGIVMFLVFVGFFINEYERFMDNTKLRGNYGI